MGCKCSKTHAPVCPDSSTLSGPKPINLPPLAEYIIPDPSPWITPISRARIIIPTCVAGDLQVQHEVFHTEQPPNYTRSDLPKSTIQTHETKQPLDVRQRDHSDEFRNQEPVALQLATTQTVTPKPDPPDEWNDMVEMKTELLPETDAVAAADSSALVPFETDKETEQPEKFNYVTPSPMNTPEPNCDTTVVEAQTFIGRDDSGAAHLINMHTIKHPTCKHDPQKGEIHIQITHKTPIHGCRPCPSEPNVRSQVENPTEMEFLGHVTERKENEGLHIRMGLPAKSGFSFKTSPRQRCHERRCKLTSGRCIPSPGMRRHTTEEHPDDDIQNDDKIYERFYMSNDIVSEPLIYPTSHIPPAKCSHARQPGYRTSVKYQNARNTGTSSFIPLETNGSAHSDMFHVTDNETMMKGMRPDKKWINVDKIQDSSIVKPHLDPNVASMYDRGLKRRKQKPSSLGDTTTDGLRHIRMEYRNRGQYKTKPAHSNYHTGELNSSLPNEPLEEWNVQSAIHHLGSSSIHFPGTRDSRKAFRRVILNRIPGLRNQDSSPQSTLSSESSQNLVSDSPYQIKDSRLTQTDEHVNLYRANSKQSVDLERLPMGKTVTQSLSPQGPSEESTTIETVTPALQNLKTVSSNETCKSVQESSSSEIRTIDQSPEEQTTSGDQATSPRTPRNKVPDEVFARIQSSTSTVRCFQAHSPSFSVEVVDYQARFSSVQPSVKEGGTKKRLSAPTPCTLPPIHSHTTVSTAVTAAVKRGGTDTNRNAKETKHDNTKGTVSLPKLSRDSTSSPERESTRTNTDRRKLRGPSQNKGKLYDILVLHQPKRK
ncbi:hypothetical protein FBUS_01427 [Fasciolopsis buskii]|uniref:Uncharacterized protein n=1 Tax=Fasciolopsis buskii TaxID=27845 RepID=A0A8E0RLD9_9TREM|nr:hypothetical protein FBUS_01427 [Fasciolopsis buski]